MSSIAWRSASTSASICRRVTSASRPRHLNYCTMALRNWWWRAYYMWSSNRWPSNSLNLGGYIDSYRTWRMALSATRCSSTRTTRCTNAVRIFHRHHCRWRAARCATTRDNDRMVRWCSSASIMLLYYHGRTVPWLLCITGSGSGGGSTFRSMTDPRNGREHMRGRRRRNYYHGWRW